MACGFSHGCRGCSPIDYVELGASSQRPSLGLHQCRHAEQFFDSHCDVPRHPFPVCISSQRSFKAYIGQRSPASAGPPPFPTLEGKPAGLSILPASHTVVSTLFCCAGARSAQSCLWKTAEHFQNEWAWFRTGAETHVGVSSGNNMHLFVCKECRA